MRKHVMVALSLIVMLSLVLTGCSAPTPQTVVQTVEVEKKVVETQQVVVTKEVVKEVIATVVAPAAAEAYPRNETLYTTGVQWGPPSSWNPFNGGGYSVGTVGLIYETLFIYDPLTDKFAPGWPSPRAGPTPRPGKSSFAPGITWTDGKPFTADDVKFTIELADPNGKYKAALGSPTCGTS